MFSGHLTCDEKRYGVTVCMKDWLTDKHNRAALLFAALFALLSALSLALALPMGLWWGENFFRREADGRFDAGAAGWVWVQEQGPDQTAFRYDLAAAGSGQALMAVDGGEVTVDYGEGLLWCGQVQNGVLLDQEGIPAGMGVVIVLSGGERENWGPERLSPLLWGLRYGSLEHRWAWQRVFPAALVFAVGLLLWLFPEKLAFLGSRWFYRQPPELSRAGLFAQRASALCVMVMSVFVLFLG